VAGWRADAVVVAARLIVGQQLLEASLARADVYPSAEHRLA
jgi:hypothetical protein